VMFVLDQVAAQGIRPRGENEVAIVNHGMTKAVFFDMRGYAKLFMHEFLAQEEGTAGLIPGPGIHLPYPHCWFELGNLDTPEARTYIANLPPIPGTRYTPATASWAIYARDEGEYVGVWKMSAEPGRQTWIESEFGLMQDVTIDTKAPIMSIKASQHMDSAGITLACFIGVLRLLDCKHQIRIGTGDTIRERTRRRCGISVGTGFHVLHLRPRKKDAEIELRERDDDPEHRLLPLFLVRGHYQTYTAEAPLFGKHIGRWWWAPQTRGDADNGIVLKSYKAVPDHA
jgi:hypothetical protein